MREPSYSELMHQYEEAGERMNVRIPEFPHSTGFKVLRILQSLRHPRDAVVLCARPDGPNTEYVVWGANMIEGGCHCGYYTSNLSNAWTEFQRRIGELN